MRDERKELEKAIAEITEIAKHFGLDFFPMRYEICPADILYTIGAYGMPTRFAHWSFGKTFSRMKMQYDFNLSKIYELVINSNPCYAFLLKGNTLLQNKLIIAHVLAHSDFFKNNVRFSRTPRDMMESMSTSAERFRQYELKYGKQAVEEFLDHVLAIQEHIDPSLFPIEADSAPSDPTSLPRSPYDDLWRLDADQPKSVQESAATSELAEQDLLLFLMKESHVLQDWQQDILTVLRNEMLYFWPQMETKIMNEGWASYWHIRIMRELDLTEEEIIDFAKLNAAVIQPSSTSINPYYLGLKIFEDLEYRYDHPTEEEQQILGRKPGQGREKMMEVRELESDISFLRNYLTEKLVEDLDLYLFEKKGEDWTITEKDWRKVRDELVRMRVNGGHPVIVVQDGDYQEKGELYLVHRYDGVELDLKYVEKTLPHLYALWGRVVHLETVIEKKQARFSFNGKKVTRRYL